MNLTIKWLVPLCLTMAHFALAGTSLEKSKSDTIDLLVAGCTNSILEPNLAKFMERGRATGHPYPDEKSAREAIAKIPKTRVYKEELLPAARSTCRCATAETIINIRTSKTQSEIDLAVKKMKPQPSQVEKCAQKYMAPVLLKIGPPQN